jgi:hypothetical protein
MAKTGKGTKKATSPSKRAKKGTTAADPKKLLTLKNSHLFIVVDPTDLNDANLTSLSTSTTKPFQDVKLSAMKLQDLIYTVYETSQENGDKKKYAYLGQVTNISKDTESKTVLTITYYDYHERGPTDARFDHWYVDEDKKGNNNSDDNDDIHFYRVHQYSTRTTEPSKDQARTELKNALVETMDKRMNSITQQLKDLESNFKANIEKIATSQKTNSTNKSASAWAQPPGRRTEEDSEQKNKQGYYKTTNTWAQNNYPSTKTWPQPRSLTEKYPTTEAQNTQVIIKEIPYERNETNYDLRGIVEKILEKKGLQPKGIVGVIDNDAIYPNEYRVRRALREGAQADPNRSPPIVIITFNTRQTKVKFLKSNKTAQGNYLDIKQSEICSKGESKPIYISENLTKHQSAIFYKARQFKATHNWTHCWTKHGVVYLKKNDETETQRIDDSEDLKKLQEL